MREPYGFIDAFRPKAADKRPSAVLDEIHKYPRWKKFIKGLWGTRAERIDLLVTGSGRLDGYRRGGDSLLGRYHQYRLHPFSLKEILAPGDSAVEESPQRTMDNILKITETAPVTIRKKLRELLRWGGFPEPFLDQNERRHRLWVRERRNLIIREETCR